MTNGIKIKYIRHFEGDEQVTYLSSFEDMHIKITEMEAIPIRLKNEFESFRVKRITYELDNDKKLIQEFIIVE